MINLIFDLNNILHRSLFIVSGYNSVMTFDDQGEIDQLMRKIVMDISYIIRSINPSRVIFAVDSKSWRKSIVIEENEGYKGQRVKSGQINWDKVYLALNEFCGIVKSQGMIVTKIDSAEADDVMCLWSKEIQENQHQNVIIVSGDEDIRQLVSHKIYEEKPVFIAVFNPFMQGKNASKKLYVSDYFETWINEPDAVDFIHMKNTMNVDKEDFKKIITSERTKMEVIDGRMIALRKLFCGDDGDNVPAIYTWIVADKNGENKEVRITNSKFEKIYEEVLNDPNEKITWKTIVERKDKVLEVIKKIVKKDEVPFDMQTRLERQIKLVVLDPSQFPEEIVEEFNKLKNEEFEKPRQLYGSLNMQDLLRGTRYLSERKSANEASIFKELDNLKGKSLF